MLINETTQTEFKRKSTSCTQKAAFVLTKSQRWILFRTEVEHNWLLGKKINSFISGCRQISLATIIQLVFQIISKIAKSRDASLNFKACWNEKEEREGDSNPVPARGKHVALVVTS